MDSGLELAKEARDVNRAQEVISTHRRKVSERAGPSSISHSKEYRMVTRSRMPSSDEIGPDTPLRLGVAAALAFPDGSMTTSGLRRESARGRLVVERIAGKDYTTLANIERMRELCRVAAKVPDCGSVQKNEMQTGRSESARSGSSEMDRARLARGALHKIARAPKGRSANTLLTSTNPAASEVATRLKS